MLDHRVLTFLTLYDEMNYRRTAEKLNMTQPGVTQHIQHLERYYGTKLFVYDGRTLSRTTAAQRLKRYFDSARAEEADLRKSLIPGNTVHITVGATKTIGEFVIVPEVRAFLRHPSHNLDLVIDNTKQLLRMLERSEIDFAVIEGVFDKSKYDCHLYKKEDFVGVCAKSHPFANRRVRLEDLFAQDIVVREKPSGTRMLLQQAITNKGFSLDSFRRCTSVNNFSVLCDLVANNGAITFAYAPISRCRDDLATFSVEDLQISGEFHFVYCNRRIAEEKIRLLFPEA